MLKFIDKQRDLSIMVIQMTFNHLYIGSNPIGLIVLFTINLSIIILFYILKI